MGTPAKKKKKPPHINGHITCRHIPHPDCTVQSTYSLQTQRWHMGYAHNTAYKLAHSHCTFCTQFSHLYVCIGALLLTHLDLFF